MGLFQVLRVGTAQNRKADSRSKFVGWVTTWTGLGEKPRGPFSSERLDRSAPGGDQFEGFEKNVWRDEPISGTQNLNQCRNLHQTLARMRDRIFENAGFRLRRGGEQRQVFWSWNVHLADCKCSCSSGLFMWAQFDDTVRRSTKFWNQNCVFATTPPSPKQFGVTVTNPKRCVEGHGCSDVPRTCTGHFKNTRTCVSMQRGACGEGPLTLHCHSENGNVTCNAKSVVFSKHYPVTLTLSSVTTKRISCIFTVMLQCIVICLAVVM